jgi:hypothetical protein
MSAASESFSALERIEAGDWDQFLHRLHGAIHLRQKTEEYRAKLIAGDDDE